VMRGGRGREGEIGEKRKTKWEKFVFKIKISCVFDAIKYK
jgi:hypothetical protein